MILTIFRPKRTRNGKVSIARNYRGRYRLNGESKITDIPLHTTDKRVAQQRLEKIVQEKQLEAVGIIPPEAIRAASQASLDTHLSDYIADLKALDRDTQYVYELENRIRRLMRECCWKQIKDVTSDSFLSWRTKQRLAPKTLNEYLVSISSLLNWMEKHERIARNPLQHVQRVQSNGKQVRPRRAFTHEEITRLLKVAGPRKAVYLTAVFTGLRRKELTALEWDDVHLDAESPFLNVRASTTKNRQQAVISLHVDVSTELRRLKSLARSSKSKHVFEGLMPTMETFKADLTAAKIEFLNDKGQRADFHSLRHTLATNLALAGTAPRVAMEIMRHSDMRLTAKTYTDAGLLPVSDAVAKLPSFTNPNVKASQIDSQNLFRARPDKSTPVNRSGFQGDSEVSENQWVESLVSTSVQTGHENEKWCAVQGLNL